MKELNINDPFVESIIKSKGMSKEDMNDFLKMEEIAKIIQELKYDYLVSSASYILLKNALEKSIFINYDPMMMEIFCDHEKNDPSYDKNYSNRYVDKAPMEICGDDECKLEINRICSEINREYSESINTTDKKVEEIRKKLRPHELRNYYNCIEGASKYIALKKIGLEEYMKTEKERSSRR